MRNQPREWTILDDKYLNLLYEIIWEQELTRQQKKWVYTISKKLKTLEGKIGGYIKDMESQIFEVYNNIGKESYDWTQSIIESKYWEEIGKIRKHYEEKILTIYTDYFSKINKYINYCNLNNILEVNGLIEKIRKMNNSDTDTRERVIHLLT